MKHTPPDREHPWNVRRLSHRHLHDHRNLLDLHLLTQAWAATHSQTLINPFDREPTLEDDTSPEDVLHRLDRAIRSVQLRELGERLSDKKLSLDESSYQAGQEAASHRWMQSDPNEGSIAPADKRALILALYHSPLGGFEGPGSFLVRRSLVTEVAVELLACPHRLAERPGQGASAETLDELCNQQFHWLRGYFGFLNPALTPVLSRPRGRCVVSW
jgi:hypothetical protein